MLRDYSKPNGNSNANTAEKSRQSASASAVKSTSRSTTPSAATIKAQPGQEHADSARSSSAHKNKNTRRLTHEVKPLPPSLVVWDSARGPTINNSSGSGSAGSLNVNNIPGAFAFAKMGLNGSCRDGALAGGLVSRVNSQNSDGGSSVRDFGKFSAAGALGISDEEPDTPFDACGGLCGGAVCTIVVDEK